MSVRGVLRRTNRAMDADEATGFLERATVMRLGTIDRDGWPYVVPLNFIYHDGKAYFHHTVEESHLTACLEAASRVCIEVDDAGPIVSRGETPCDTGQVFTSVIAFGRASLVTDPVEQEQFFDRLMIKYVGPEPGLSRSYPRGEATLVFQIDIEVLTGKRRESG